MNFDCTTDHRIRQIAKFPSLHYLHVLHGDKHVIIWRKDIYLTMCYISTHWDHGYIYG